MKKILNRFYCEKGVTLVELLTSIVIVSIISALAYGVLFQGYSNYQRIKVESELRDEADLIMISLIQELFTLKNSEVETLSICSNNQKNSLLKVSKKNTSTGATQAPYNIGFQDDKLQINSNKIEFFNENIELVPVTCIANSPTSIIESSDGNAYTIKFTLRTIKNNNEHEMTFTNTIQVIDDVEEGAVDATS